MKNIKKLLSLLLCGIMLFGMFPASLFAADGGTGRRFRNHIRNGRSRNHMEENVRI